MFKKLQMVGICCSSYQSYKFSVNMALSIIKKLTKEKNKVMQDDFNAYS